MRSMLRPALAALLLPTLLLPAVPALAQDIGVHDAYAITAVPGAPTGTAYMLIHNHGSASDRLIGAFSPVADRVEIHENLDEDGVIRMRHVEEGLELRAGGSLLLDRGGPHLMFLGISDPFEDGDVIPVTLTFETAGEVAVDVTVELDRLTGKTGEGHEHGDHDAHEGAADHEAMDHDAMEGMDHGEADGHAGGQGG